MAATIDIDRMIEICFAAQFFVYGYMALFLYPYNDYDAAPPHEAHPKQTVPPGAPCAGGGLHLPRHCRRVRAMSGIPHQREWCGGLGIASRPGLPHPVLHGTCRDAVGAVRLRCHRS